MSLRDWICAYDLACPEIKYSYELAKWICLESDPCNEGRCEEITCNNYKKPFSEPDRLITVLLKDEKND